MKIIASSLCNFILVDCCIVASFLDLVKKKRKHRSRRGKGAAATRWSPRNKQKTEGPTGSEGAEDLKGVAKDLSTSQERKKTTSAENVSTEKRKKVGLHLKRNLHAFPM
jgi:hypothetical protein